MLMTICFQRVFGHKSFGAALLLHMRVILNRSFKNFLKKAQTVRIKNSTNQIKYFTFGIYYLPFQDEKKIKSVTVELNHV